MACALSANSCCYSSASKGLLRNKCYETQKQRSFNCLRIRASANEEEDCNVEECAPDKEVGKVSMEWLAGEKTKVAGTFPPRKRGWTGYVEKDTAGQTNIYSVEPAVYVAESAFSSGSAGSSDDGADSAAARAAGIAFVCVAAISLIAFELGKVQSPIQTAGYSGPSLSYYINKFKPPELVPASLPTEAEISTPAERESSSPEIVDVQVGPTEQEVP